MKMMPLSPPRYSPARQRCVPLGDAVETAIHPVFSAIYRQLPEGLRDRLSVRLQMDCYFIACVATFSTEDGREFETRLTPMELPDGKVGAARIPEWFVAHLCLII